MLFFAGGRRYGQGGTGGGGTAGWFGILFSFGQFLKVSEGSLGDLDTAGTRRWRSSDSCRIVD